MKFKFILFLEKLFVLTKILRICNLIPTKIKVQKFQTNKNIFFNNMLTMYLFQQQQVPTKKIRCLKYYTIDTTKKERNSIINSNFISLYSIFFFVLSYYIIVVLHSFLYFVGNIIIIYILCETVRKCNNMLYSWLICYLLGTHKVFGGVEVGMQIIELTIIRTISTFRMVLIYMK